jgi:hypothetical protein
LPPASAVGFPAVDPEEIMMIKLQDTPKKII